MSFPSFAARADVPTWDTAASQNPVREPARMARSCVASKSGSQPLSPKNRLRNTNSAIAGRIRTLCLFQDVVVFETCCQHVRPPVASSGAGLRTAKRPLKKEEYFHGVLGH